MVVGNPAKLGKIALSEERNGTRIAFKTKNSSIIKTTVKQRQTPQKQFGPILECEAFVKAQVLRGPACRDLGMWFPSPPSAWRIMPCFWKEDPRRPIGLHLLLSLLLSLVLPLGQLLEPLQDLPCIHHTYTCIGIQKNIKILIIMIMIIFSYYAMLVCIIWQQFFFGQYDSLWPTGSGLLQRCDMEETTSSGNVGSDENDGDEEAGSMKRPAAKTTSKRKKKEEPDTDVTSLGACKGNDDDEDQDEQPAGEPKKSRKKKDKDDKKKVDKPRKKKDDKEKKTKKTKGGKKREDAADSGSSMSSAEDGQVVSEGMLKAAFDRANQAETSFQVGISVKHLVDPC